jgi:hypothetical protein
MNIVALAISLLALATAAHAECAWVLWQEDETKMAGQVASVEWAVPVAFSDRASCVAWIDTNVKNWERSAEPNQPVTRAASGTAAEFRTRTPGRADTWIATRLRCLPDTVDPRGPKGK